MTTFSAYEYVTAAKLNAAFAEMAAGTKAGSSVVTLSGGGTGTVTFPAPFATALTGAVVCNGDVNFLGDSTFCLNWGACNAAGLGFSVFPNPGAVNVRVQWVAVGS